ncbi:hypothetical protein [Chryseobacterium sp. 18068]|uniref:hypothetical protein n=1 Tax=Chryseobacterium sp. 18068 TaxID=2681414 RepID=UPI0013588804|nr:hypothetical protein [Chryseobacterium sp. 18068]
MWNRYKINCQTCEKVTNVRLHIPEKEKLELSFNCPNCSSEIKGVLHVNLEEGSFYLDMKRGNLVYGHPNQGDYFYEYSDTIITNKPSEELHNIMLPTFRLPRKQFDALKDRKDLRLFFSEDIWTDLKDLTRAYIRFDMSNIEKVGRKILGNKNDYVDYLECKIEPDFHRIYFLSLNHIIYPWIDFDNHRDFVLWLTQNVFVENNVEELKEFVDVFDEYVCEKIREDMGGLLIRFIDLKDYFLYANPEDLRKDGFAAINNFDHLKTFYTDCFEFMGRTSQYVFRLQNIYERGNQNSVPPGTPRNVTDADSFALLKNGLKLSIIELSTEENFKRIYRNCFDSRLRNGINHFKVKIDANTQLITYFPLENRSSQEFTIQYIDFLNKSLQLFNSALKIGQIMKMVANFRGFGLR